MTPSPLAVVILAAGKGTRMNSGSLPKVLVKTVQKPLIDHLFDALNSLITEKIIVVVGHEKESVKEHLKERNLYFAEQLEQKGTGHAVLAARQQLEGFKGTVLILCGDVPLTTSSTLKEILALHDKERATITVTTFNADPDGSYGRIIRAKGSSNEVIGIVEAKDCSPEQKTITEANAGIYAVDSSFLIPILEKINNKNSQGEYYLTDIIELAHKEGQRVSGYQVKNDLEVKGVNSPMELAMINEEIIKSHIKKLQSVGVVFLNPGSVYIEPSVKIAGGVTIGLNVQIFGDTSIAEGTIIEGSAWIKNCQIGENTEIRIGTRAEDSVIGSGSLVGPFAHLRPGTKLGSDVKVGNFVEVKNSTLADGAKASHLSYIGDAEVGREANIGAGTITCNYDGKNKNKTFIGEKTFIGSNSCLVAPVTIGNGAYVGAGSVITKDVAPGSLAVGRAQQIEKKGWAERKNK